MAQNIGYELRKPVGFFPLFYNLAEAGRAVVVAKRVVERGGTVVFFSHGGQYEYLALDAGFRIVRCDPVYSDDDVSRIIRVNRGEQQGVAYPVSFLWEVVKGEIAAFKKTGVGMVVSFVNIPCVLSTRAVGIPLVTVQPAMSRFHVRVPDAFEVPVLRWLPQRVKVPVLNYVFSHSKRLLGPFNSVAGELGLPLFRSTLSMVMGDVTLGTDYQEFIQVFSHEWLLPAENYVGIIPLEELFADAQKSSRVDPVLAEHISGDRRSILVTMGSSGDKDLFIRVLKILDTLPYSVVAIVGNIVAEEELPPLSKKIVVRHFVPSIDKIHRLVDLSIIHGGQGTVYAAAYAGKPVIGFPMQFEQHLNLEKLVGHGMGLMLSRWHFKDQDLLKAIQTIFSNYAQYVDKAQQLAQKLPPPQGDIRTAERILTLCTSFGLIKNKHFPKDTTS
ncbi:MAG: hypothetical protein KKG04_09700 [Candidatus Thermoplasmatota archaeon]|nr:hypothetical protein [Candidatus Thermoplasmatota archaeon]